MTKINKGRFSADVGADGTVLFLIGMRINCVWQIWKWLPVFVAMPRMLIELQRDRSLGLVGKPRTLVSGRVILVWQYWESFEKLEQYARATDNEHLPAWRRFNRRVRANGTVGIYHETILLSDQNVETVYANMPIFGLAGVTGAVPAGSRGQSASLRLGTRQHDEPPVAPY
jgi:hypothetical protein